MDNNALKNFIKSVLGEIKLILNKFKKFVNKIFNALKKFGYKKTKKIIHLSQHAKKYRVRKKNIHRLMRC